MSRFTMGLVSVILIIGMFLTMFWVIMVSYRFTELLERHLNRSMFVAGNRQIFSFAGLPGKVLRNGLIAMLFFFPGIFERRGLIEKNELSNVPAHLKRKLLATWIPFWILIFSMIVFWLLVGPWF